MAFSAYISPMATRACRSLVAVIPPAPARALPPPHVNLNLSLRLRLRQPHRLSQTSHPARLLSSRLRRRRDLVHLPRALHRVAAAAVGARTLLALLPALLLAFLQLQASLQACSSGCDRRRGRRRRANTQSALKSATSCVVPTSENHRALATAI